VSRCTSTPHRADLNYEGTPSYEIEVSATDSLTTATADPKSIRAVFTIVIVDVAEPPNFISLSGSTVEENAVIGTAVGNITAKDQDAGELLAFSLIEGEPPFRLRGGSLTCADAVAGGVTCSVVLEVAAGVDFEVRPSHTVMVEVRTGGVCEEVPACV